MLFILLTLPQISAINNHQPTEIYMSKFEKAANIFNANAGINRKDFIAKCVEIGIGATTAQTYFYKLKDSSKVEAAAPVDKQPKVVKTKTTAEKQPETKVGGRWDDPEFANFTENDIPAFLKK